MAEPNPQWPWPLKDHEYNSLDLSYKAIVLNYLSCYLEEAVAIETAPTIKQASTEQSKMLRLRTENMEVIIRLINSRI